ASRRAARRSEGVQTKFRWILRCFSPVRLWRFPMRSRSNAPSRKTAKKRPSKSTPLSLADFVQIAHSELRRIAGSYFQNERPHHTLQPTALVHEVFVRLSFY